jgi:hypothetical protein
MSRWPGSVPLHHRLKLASDSELRAGESGSWMARALARSLGAAAGEVSPRRTLGLLISGAPGQAWDRGT